MQHLLQLFQLEIHLWYGSVARGDLPVLCYMVGFAKSSNILEPVLVGTTGNHIKDVTLLPFAHEFERNVAAAAFLASADCINVRAWRTVSRSKHAGAPWTLLLASPLLRAHRVRNYLSILCTTYLILLFR